MSAKTPEQILRAEAYMDHDGPCWCYLRNAGPYEALGHTKDCKDKKRWWAETKQEKSA